MGLDMYLNGHRFLSEYTDEDKDVIDQLDKIIPNKPGSINTIVTEAAYWRKANAIHDWFVRNVQDGEDECREHDVSRANMHLLVETCKQVQADHELASTLLPPVEGFFFGGTELDDWYFDGLASTIEMLEPLLSDDYKHWWFTYRSSW